MKNKRALFFVKVHSQIDVITNSSSELFVGLNKSRETLLAAIEALYPNYLSEYEPLKNIDEITPRTLDLYFDFATSPGHWPSTKDEYPILPGFTFDELYEVDDDDSGYNNSKHTQYRLRNNDSDKENSRWGGSFVTEENFEEIKNKLDPNREMFFLFSIGENPDFEYQEELEKIMIRYHLG